MEKKPFKRKSMDHIEIICRNYEYREFCTQSQGLAADFNVLTADGGAGGFKPAPSMRTSLSDARNNSEVCRIGGVAQNN
jgi:hypothetical protein